MNKKERYAIADVLESVCNATQNGDYPGSESSHVIIALCKLLSVEDLLDGVDPMYYPVLLAYGGLTKRGADLLKAAQNLPAVVNPSDVESPE